MKCCICGKTIEGFGNNPYPIYADDNEARCCDSCNNNIVIPLRILALQRKRTGDETEEPNEKV